MDDVLKKAAVAQWSASRSENCQCVGSTLGVMFQQVRERRKRNVGSGINEMCGRHGSRPTRNYGLRISPEVEDFDGERTGGCISPDFAICASPSSSQEPISRSRYIVVAVVRF